MTATEAPPTPTPRTPRRSKSLFTPEIMWPAIGQSFVKLDPRVQVRNPVMFVVEVGAVITAGLLVVLVPAYGGLGAAAAVVVREAGMLVLFSIAAATGLATDTVGVFLRQSLWLVVPLAALVALNAVLPNLSLFASLGLVIASVIAIEWLGGWSLYRDLLGIRTSDS